MGRRTWSRVEDQDGPPNSQVIMFGLPGGVGLVHEESAALVENVLCESAVVTQ